MQKIGYVRGNSDDSRVKQIQALKDLGITDIVIEVDGYALVETIRDVLDRGDSLYITGLDRLSRDIKEVTNILEALYYKGVDLIVDGERYYLDKFVLYSNAINQLSAK